METTMSLEEHARAYYGGQPGLGIGSQFMAVIFDALFAGVLLCQLTHWLPNFKHDAPHVRYIAGFGALGALAATVFTWNIFIDTFVFNYGEYTRFASLNDLGWYRLLDMLSVIPVQLIFAERAIKVNKRNKIVIFVIGTLVLATISFAMSILILTRNRTVFDVTETTRNMMTMWSVCCTSAHLFITGSIIFGLVKYRQGLMQSSSVIDRLLYTSIESQLPATCVAVAGMVVNIFFRRSPISPLILIVHPKVFIVGCMAMLNSRHTWQKNGKLPSNGQHSVSGKAITTSSDMTLPPTEVRQQGLGNDLDSDLHISHPRGTPRSDFEKEQSMSVLMGLGYLEPEETVRVTLDDDRLGVAGYSRVRGDSIGSPVPGKE